MKESMLISPQASARLVVTMPPEPSKLSSALEKDIGKNYVSFTPTTDAFVHLANIAQQRFTIMIPYIDRVGVDWASDLFELTNATERYLILRDIGQLNSLGLSAKRLKNSASRVIDYGGERSEEETFHAKIVLADGRASYVGSANLLHRAKARNLECGMLVEGPAVHAVKVLVEAVIRISDEVEPYSIG